MRSTITAGDLTSAALIQSRTGRIYRLGPPKLINKNRNVVNHCQLYYRTVDAVIPPGRWYNLAMLKAAGFKLYVHTGQLPLVNAKC